MVSPHDDMMFETANHMAQVQVAEKIAEAVSFLNLTVKEKKLIHTMRLRLVVNIVEVLHACIATMLRGEAGEDTSEELLFAALFVHFSNGKHDDPFECAKRALAALDHEVPTNLKTWKKHL